LTTVSSKDREKLEIDVYIPLALAYTMMHVDVDIQDSRMISGINTHEKYPCSEGLT
jgi:hypothetical protein